MFVISKLPGLLQILAVGLSFGVMTACTPAVQVELPKEPININLNVKIQHEILIKIDKELDDMFSKSSGLF
ncbi:MULTISPECIES: YnbE family lipoprotein [Thiomicrorhabdus]|uniref:YnbE family lipoprotein n=1 Tax=Thiomicrorhabdus heinhorstiae TaxID=2748010 RepID=A0ABS0BW83_9GAMM|nr:YnbE family lipoprotein [Thiomicrorhabdus heinhorstiae]